MSFEESAILLAWLAIVLLALAMSGLIRQLRFLTRQLRELRAGSSQMPSQVGTLAPAVLNGHRDASTRILLFAQPNCIVCADRVEELQAISERDGATLEFAVLIQGDNPDFPVQDIPVLTRQQPVFEQLRIPVTPFAVVVAPNGLIMHAAPVGASGSLDEVLRIARSVS